MPCLPLLEPSKWVQAYATDTERWQLGVRFAYATKFLPWNQELVFQS